MRYNEQQFSLRINFDKLSHILCTKRIARLCKSRSSSGFLFVVCSVYISIYTCCDCKSKLTKQNIVVQISGSYFRISRALLTVQRDPLNSDSREKCSRSMKSEVVIRRESKALCYQYGLKHHLIHI